MLKKENSMISLVMLHLKVEQVVPEDLTLVDLISETFLVAVDLAIFLVISLAAEAEAAQEITAL